MGMETTRCQPSNETGVQMEIQHLVTGDRVMASVTDDKDLKIGTWNVEGLLNRLDSSDFVSFF